MSAESNPLSRRKPLSKPERKLLDRRIAERIIEISERLSTPKLLKEVEPLRGFIRELDEGYPASRPDRWVFPSVGAQRGSEQAKKAERAAQGRDTSNLRMVTLRIGERKPKAEELADHLKLLSETARSCCDYLARRGLARPIISVVQLRRDRTEAGPSMVFDPHIHGIWDLPPDAIDGVRRYLEARFAPVWIDDAPIRDIKGAVFYVSSGMLDYRDVPSWPDDAIEAVLALPPMRMIRPAGWLADPSRIDSAKIDLEARQRGPKRESRSPARSRPQTDQRAENTALERRAPSGRLRATARASTPTVRVSASESLNLGKTPTLSELWFVRYVIARRLAGQPASVFDDTCAKFGIPLSEAIEAVRVTQALFKTSLFYPGDDWIPTEAAKPFMEGSLSLLVGIDSLHLELRSEAVVAGERLSEAREPRR